MKSHRMSGQQWASVIAAWSGWLMDGYVSIAYLLMAGYISLVFFPSNFADSLIVTVAGFGAGSVARFAGSAIFGTFLGDRLGRRNMLMITVIGFSVSSFLIGLLPTYSSAGYVALFLLYFLLVLVGLFAGAEYGGGTALYAESVPAELRGVVGAFVQSGYGTGYFVAAGVYAIIGMHYSETGFVDFAWRILFLTTIIPGIIAVVSRFGAKETPVFQDMVKTSQVDRHPFIRMLKNPLPVLMAMVVTSGLLYLNAGTFGFYPILMSHQINNIPATTSGLILVVVNLVSLFGVWIGGFLSFLIPGRRLAMIVFSSIFIVFLYPLTYFGIQTGVSTLYITYSVQAFLEAMIFSTLPSFLAEKFSKSYRTTSVGFTYNFGAIAAGWAPTIILISAGTLGLLNAWFINLVIANILLIIGLAFSVETWKKSKAGERDVITE